MNKNVLLLAICLLWFSPCFSHPGIGIGIDSKGNVYYTDLKEVWKLKPDGSRSIAVPGVHTHELYIDTNDDLYGEHLWYNGEKLNTWGHFAWRLSHTGKLDTLIGPAEGFLTNYSFLRDRLGNMYWIERFVTSRFRKMTPSGEISTIGEGKFRDIRWSYCSKDGTVYFIDLDRLYKLSPGGEFSLLSKELDDPPTLLGLLGEKRHRVYGIWADAQDNIYVALHAAKKVKRITPGGKTETIVYTSGQWSPTSGVFDQKANLWLLEYGIFGNCRVRKIKAGQMTARHGRTEAFILNYVFPLGLVATLMGLTGIFIVRRFRKLYALSKNDFQASVPEFFYEKNTLKIILVFLTTCAGRSDKLNSEHASPVASSADYQWTRLTENAAFPKGYNFQLFSVRDTLWAMHHEGSWFSVNGKEWIRSTLANVIQNNAFLDYVWFKNSLYGIGSFSGNIDHFTLRSSIFRTTDMKKWDTLALASNLPKRFFYHPFVFNDKLWIIGGTDGKESFADIWNSDDGIQWKKQADNLPFGKRDNSQFVFFNNKIFLLNNDVWSSTDGLNWINEAHRLMKDDIFGYAPVVYDGQIWLLGCNRNGIFKSEVIMSKDGKKWTAERAPWSPRGGIAACVYNGKIFMTGGKYGGPGISGQTEFVYSNDVWTLGKKNKSE